MAELSDQEMLRYNRQIILRGFDFDGQEALKDSRVLVVGLGGLGCAASQYLASAGVGNLTLLDFDTVSLSNLQRQTLHSDATVGQPKVDSARDALTRINPHIAITPVNALLDDAELAAMIAKHDLVLDCTDNVQMMLFDFFLADFKGIPLLLLVPGLCRLILIRGHTDH